MRAGESFKITGTSTHVSNAGGGVGTSVGADGIGSVRLSAGVDVTYTVNGRNSVDVTRGDGNSARIVVSAEDKMTVGGDIKAVAGAKPDYAKLGSAIGTDNLPQIGTRRATWRRMSPRVLRKALVQCRRTRGWSKDNWQESYSGCTSGSLR